MAEKKGIKIAAQNRKAFHDYFVEDRYEAGIELFGTEVKSIRMGGQVHPRRHAQPERQLCHRQKRRGERAVDAHFALRQGQYLQP